MAPKNIPGSVFPHIIAVRDPYYCGPGSRELHDADLDPDPGPGSRELHDADLEPDPDS